MASALSALAAAGWLRLGFCFGILRAGCCQRPLRDVYPRRDRGGELHRPAHHHPTAAPRAQYHVSVRIFFPHPIPFIDHLPSPPPAGRRSAQEHPVKPMSSSVRRIPALDAALGYAQESGIPYGVALLKTNMWAARSSITSQRESSVRIKLDNTSTRAGERVVLSMVRSSADPPSAPAPSSCCATPAPRKSTAAFRAPPFAHPLLFRHRHPEQKT